MIAIVGPYLYKIAVKIINLIIVNRSEEAKEHILKMCDDEDPLVRIMAALGIEMSKYISISRETWKEIDDLQRKIDCIVNQFFLEEKYEYLEFLSVLKNIEFKADFGNMKMEEVIGSLLTRVKDKKKLERFLFGAVEEKRIEASAVYPWLYFIGDEDTLRELKRKLKILELEDGLELRSLMRHLESKQVN